jgi:glycyl-tRNA synthetase (class II)
LKDSFVYNIKRHLMPSQVRDVRVLLYSSCHQVDGKTAEYKTIGEAVDDRIIANETLAYYMARTQMYMVKIGVDPKKLRFRQHISKEMAQFAFDCWHAECLTSYVRNLTLHSFCCLKRTVFVARAGSNALVVLIVQTMISLDTPRPLVFLW